MPIRFGDKNITNIKFGDTQILKVYKGDDLVWTKEAPRAPPPGDTWTNITSLQSAVSNNRMRSIAWSGTQFCAVGYSAKCATSPDGVNWTPQNNLYSLLGNNWQMNSIVWSPELSMFCAIAAYQYFSGESPDSRCFTSPDGVTWSEQVSFRTLFGDIDMNSVTWSGTQFCAVGWKGRCGTSSDGVTWTNQPNLKIALEQQYATALQMKSIAWDGSQFCVVGESSGCATSPDGVTWTTHIELAFKTNLTQLNSIVWSPELSMFCTVGARGMCATSPDGVTWTKQDSLSSASDRQSMWAVTQTGNSFCAVGNKATCATSPDGVTWTNQTAFNDALYAQPGQLQPAMWAVAWSGTSLCAVGDSGRCATTP